MRRRWVLVSQRQTVGPHGELRDALETAYVKCLERNGLLPLPVPNALREIGSFLEGALRCEGIVLTGGNDVCPSEYGEEALECLDVSRARDRTERALLDLAVRRPTPVLGICRGMQFINVYFGGRLIQDMKRQLGRDGHPPATTHRVEIVDEGARAYLGRSALEVNSYHDQAVVEAGLAPVLRPFALERGAGAIEGFYHPGYPIAGVQFHPERRPGDGEISSHLLGAFRDREWCWRKGRGECL